MGRKTAIITGANRGVGRGVANVFAEKGYHSDRQCEDK